MKKTKSIQEDITSKLDASYLYSALCIDNKLIVHKVEIDKWKKLK